MGKPATRRIIVGISGASGTPYARALLNELTKLDLEIHLIVSSTALVVMHEEMGLSFAGDTFDLETFTGSKTTASVIQHDNRNMAAAPASGTFRTSGMIICPCSMKTLGQIAHGVGENLITRAADACLKERRRLVLVPRETPLNLVHLRNMTAVTEAGAVVLPAMPGFYQKPQSIDDLLRHLVLKMLDALEIEHDIHLRWRDE